MLISSFSGHLDDIRLEIALTSPINSSTILLALSRFHWVLRAVAVIISSMATVSWFLGFLYSQFLVTPPKVTRLFTDQTVIVTGSNTGLGLEAARQIVTLNAARVILAVRTTSKGEAAKKAIEESTGRTGVVEVWPLDLSSYESVKHFAVRATKELHRVDVLLENAGMQNLKFEITEQDESAVSPFF